jgi:hypothetical protein
MSSPSSPGKVPASPPAVVVAVPASTPAAPGKIAIPSLAASSPPLAVPKPVPGKLMIKTPEPAPLAQEKKRPSVLEGLEKPRDMKSLMEKVAAGMKKSAPEEEQQHVVEPAAAEEESVGQPQDDAGSAAATAAATTAAAAAADGEHKQQEEGGETQPVHRKSVAEEDVNPAKSDDGAAAAAAAAAPSLHQEPDAAAEERPTEPEEIPVPRPTIRGPNFAMEAMKIRQAQMNNRKSARAPAASRAEQELDAAVNEDAAPQKHTSVQAGVLDNQAALSKPKIAAKRRAPKMQEMSKLLPKAEIDRMTHENTFRMSVDGAATGSNVLWVHATSQIERNMWVEILSSAIQRLSMKRDLEDAQRSDMLRSLECQMALEEFLKTNATTYAGFLEKLSMKSHRNWKKRYFELNDQGQVLYYDNEKSKKSKHTLQLSHLSVVASADGTRLNGPIVMATGASASAEAGELCVGVCARGWLTQRTQAGQHCRVRRPGRDGGLEHHRGAHPRQRPAGGAGEDGAHRAHGRPGRRGAGRRGGWRWRGRQRRVWQSRGGPRV